MENLNIQIDLGEELLVYEKENLPDLNLSKKIYEIIYFLLNKEKIYINQVSVSINSISGEEIKYINNKYRGIDEITDVLSFPIFEKNELENNKILKEIELGDIFICLDVVEKQAEEYQTGLKRELIYMITHGLCHLFGFDHLIEEDKKQMRIIEEEILEKIGVGLLNE